jgi:hypothetical protein
VSLQSSLYSCDSGALRDKAAAQTKLESRHTAIAGGNYTYLGRPSFSLRTSRESPIVPAIAFTADVSPQSIFRPQVIVGIRNSVFDNRTSA